jgi:predicted DNA binding protein
MPVRRFTIDVPSDLLVRSGVVPLAFFAHNESVEILRVFGFLPRERLLLVRVLRGGPPRTMAQVSGSRAKLRRRYHLRDFEILRIEEDGRAYVALLRQTNPGVLETILEELGAGLTLTTPTVIRREVATLSFLADDGTAKQVFDLLDRMGIRWNLRRRHRIPHGPSSAEEILTGRQKEILGLAWSLGYYDVPARIGLAKLSDLTGLSRNTVSQHLRRGLRRILRDSLAST